MISRRGKIISMNRMMEHFNDQDLIRVETQLMEQINNNTQLTKCEIIQLILLTFEPYLSNQLIDDLSKNVRSIYDTGVHTTKKGNTISYHKRSQQCEKRKNRYFYRLATSNISIIGSYLNKHDSIIFGHCNRFLYYQTQCYSYVCNRLNDKLMVDNELLSKIINGAKNKNTFSFSFPNHVIFDSDHADDGSKALKNIQRVVYEWKRNKNIQYNNILNWFNSIFSNIESLKLNYCVHIGPQIPFNILFSKCCTKKQSNSKLNLIFDSFTYCTDITKFAQKYNQFLSSQISNSSDNYKDNTKYSNYINNNDSDNDDDDTHLLFLKHVRQIGQIWIRNMELSYNYLNALLLKFGTNYSHLTIECNVNNFFEQFDSIKGLYQVFHSRLEIFDIISDDSAKLLFNVGENSDDDNDHDNDNNDDDDNDDWEWEFCKHVSDKNSKKSQLMIAKNVSAPLKPRAKDRCGIKRFTTNLDTLYQFGHRLLLLKNLHKYNILHNIQVFIWDLRRRSYSDHSLSKYETIDKSKYVENFFNYLLNDKDNFKQLKYIRIFVSDINLNEDIKQRTTYPSALLQPLIFEDADDGDDDGGDDDNDDNDDDDDYDEYDEYDDEEIITQRRRIESERPLLKTSYIFSILIKLGQVYHKLIENGNDNKTLESIEINWDFSKCTSSKQNDNINIDQKKQLQASGETTSKFVQNLQTSGIEMKWVELMRQNKRNNSNKLTKKNNCKPESLNDKKEEKEEEDTDDKKRNKETNMVTDDDYARIKGDLSFESIIDTLTQVVEWFGIDVADSKGKCNLLKEKYTLVYQICNTVTTKAKDELKY